MTRTITSHGWPVVRGSEQAPRAVEQQEQARGPSPLSRQSRPTGQGPTRLLHLLLLLPRPLATAAVVQQVRPSARSRQV